jgi:hypothetical protein
MVTVNVTPDTFHGEWNYTIRPDPHCESIVGARALKAASSSHSCLRVWRAVGDVKAAPRQRLFIRYHDPGAAGCGDSAG